MFGSTQPSAVFNSANTSQPTTSFGLGGSSTFGGSTGFGTTNTFGQSQSTPQTFQSILQPNNPSSGTTQATNQTSFNLGGLNSFGANTFGGTTSNTFGGAAGNTFGGVSGNAFGSSTVPSNTFGGLTSGTNTFGSISNPSTNAFSGTAFSTTGKTNLGNAFGGSTNFGNSLGGSTTGIGNTFGGSTMGTNLFGGSTTGTTTFGGLTTGNNNFGGFQTQPQGFQSIIQPNNSLSNSIGFSQQQQQQQQQQVYFIQNIVEPFSKIIRKYAPLVDGQGNPITHPVDSFSRTNPDCKFTSISYRNKATQNSLYPLVVDIPFNEMSYDINRGHEDLIAQKEYGVTRLKLRFENQNNISQKLIDQSKDLNDIVQSLDKNISQLQLRYQALRSKHSQLQLSLLIVLRKIEVIRSHGVPIQPAELKYRDNLNHLAKALTEPSKKLQEIMIIKSQHEKDEDKFIEVVNDEDMSLLYNLLEKQRQGLEVLTDILAKDIRDINIVKNALMEKQK